MDGAEPTFSAGSAVGVLLLHDLAGSPQTVQSMADTLAEAGYSVDVPLLPGHGTEIADLMDMTWDDWAGAAQLALDELASRTGNVIVLGIGMGATLGCWVAAMHPEVLGVIAINPRTVPVPQEAIDMMGAMIADGAMLTQPLGPDVSDQTIPVVGYDTVPVATLISMFQAIDDMAGHWSDLKCPVLIVTSARDHRVSPYNAEYLAEHAGGPVERLTLERSFHLATVDVDHEALEAATLDFIKRVAV